MRYKKFKQSLQKNGIYLAELKRTKKYITCNYFSLAKYKVKKKYYLTKQATTLFQYTKYVLQKIKTQKLKIKTS